MNPGNRGLSGHRTRNAGLLAIGVLLLMLGASSPARAGQWMQVSCVNPDGSAAPNEGWQGATSGSLPVNSDNVVSCGPGMPMSATILASGPTTGGGETLTYTPPQGSTLAGGSLNVTLSGDAHSSASPNNASGAAAVLAPDPELHPADELIGCAYWTAGCWRGTGAAFQPSDDWSGTVSIPSNIGGTLTVVAGCLVLPSGGQCDANANATSDWARATMSQADLLLSSSASPQGSGFSGSALQSHATGTTHLIFTASDPNGPGVYQVAAYIDGRAIYGATPNTNDGHCIPVGTDPSSGALMFDWAQPCPPTTNVDVAVPTAQLPDGRHELTVVVGDAAHDTSTVLDEEITTHNPTVTPAPHGPRALRARFHLSWRWAGTRTTLLSVVAHHLPRGGEIAVSCDGTGCPKLPVRSVTTRHWAKIAGELGGSNFTAGDRLFLNVTAPHHHAEHVLVTMRDAEKPAATLRR